MRLLEPFGTLARARRYVLSDLLELAGYEPGEANDVAVTGIQNDVAQARPGAVRWPSQGRGRALSLCPKSVHGNLKAVGTPEPAPCINFKIRTCGIACCASR